MTYQGKMDVECIDICDAMNLFPGIQTIDSCCGHNERPYRIFFMADKLENLPRLLYYFDQCHCGFRGWTVRVYTDCSMCPTRFIVEGPIGQIAYKQSKKIAEYLIEEIGSGRKEGERK